MHPNQNRILLRHSRGPGRQGFTLIELMVTVAIMAILLGIAAPSFNDVLLGSKLGSNANNLVAATLAARSEAIKRNAAVTMCVSADGTNCATTGGWEQGWIVKCNTIDHTKCNPTGASTIVMQRQQALPSGLKLTGADASGAVIRLLTFQPTGVDATQATLTVCRATPSAGAQERVVTVSATGRASVRKTTTGICS
jgi:type IV fimbrial biogenesis protein FimT